MWPAHSPGLLPAVHARSGSTLRAASMASLVAVQLVPQVGTTLVSAAECTASTILFEDVPICVWRCSANDRLGSAEFLKRFSELDVETQQDILAMSYPSQSHAHPSPPSISADLDEESTRMSKLLSLADALGLDKELVPTLLLIRDVNCHDYVENAADVDEGAAPRVALYRRASKLTHSCRPNTYMQGSGQRVQCVAARDLSPSSVLTTSYVGDLYGTPRMERRAALSATKHFLCTCLRCLGRDDCRGLQCCTEACRGYMYEEDSLDGSPSCWSCTTCRVAHPAHSPALQAQLREEDRLAHAVGEVDRRMRGGGQGMEGAVAPQELQALADEVCQALSPIHYLRCRALRLQVQLWTAAKRSCERVAILLGMPAIPCPWGAQGEQLTERQCCAGAGCAAEASVRLRECVAAGCAGPPHPARPHTTCQLTHPPVRDAVADVWWAVQDLLGSEQAGLARVAVRLYKDYLPMLLGHYGQGDREGEIEWPDIPEGVVQAERKGTHAYMEGR